MLNIFKKLNPRGDTIVEVMVVLAILGLALGICFTTANSSLTITRGAQENAQATSLLQSQIESLRYLASPTSGQNIFIPGPFCISSTFTVVPESNEALWNADCVNVDSTYTLSITYQAVPAPNGRTFTLVGKWPDALGHGVDSATLVYRLYP
jgi:type II secretory pathway pseudopilin PulG